MKNFVLIAFCLFGSVTAIQAQTAFPATGGNATGTNGSVSYTIGQITYNDYLSAAGTVSEGVQQPYEILTIGTDDAKDVKLAYSIHPNPTYGSLKLKTENISTKDLWFRLYDLNSRLLLSRKIDATEMEIPMENFVPATYLLIIIESQKEIKTFKIIKTR